MAYTTDLTRVEETLEQLGVDVKQAKEILSSGKAGFTVNYNELEPQEAFVATQRLRTALYSWLYGLGIKMNYAVKVRHFAVQVCRKINPEIGSSTFVAGIMIGMTHKGSKKSSLAILGEQEVLGSGSYNQNSDVMPDEESTFLEDRLQAAIEGNEDAFPNDGFEEFQRQQAAGGIMPQSYDPKDIFPVPKEFVTPAGLKGIDEVVDLDSE